MKLTLFPYSNPKNYIKQSKLIAEDLSKTNSNGVYWANQFDNLINTEAHIQTTAEEIWNQTAGTINGFTCSVGNGWNFSWCFNRFKRKK